MRPVPRSLAVALALATALATVVALTLPAPADAIPDPPLKTTTGVTEPVYTQTIREEYRVETPHGVMYGWVERPDPVAYPDLYATGQGSAGPGVPVVLVLSPYNVIYQPLAEEPPVLERAAQDFFVTRGYAYAQFDVVGTRESGGCYDYGGIRERETGAAVVDHLGAQPWANGRVGMIGGSYDGTTQLAAAVEAPEHLAAIIPQVAIDRWYDYAYGGGIRYFLNSEDPTDEGFDTPLAFDLGFAILPPSSVEPESVDVIADRIRPCDRLLHTDAAYRTDPVYDGFWDERDYRTRAGNVRAAVLIEGGWLDHNVKHWGSTRFYEALPPGLPKKLVMGQWAHSASQFEDAWDIRHAWFDRFLLDLDTGVTDLPPVDTELNTGERRQEPSWPPPGTQDVAVPLVDDGGSGLTLQGGASTYHDADKTLTEDAALGDACHGRCLVFLSPPLTDDVRISGGPTLDLQLTSTEAETHLVPVLFDEAPDGSREIITRGFLNSRNREGLDTSSEVVPGVAYGAPVPVWDVDWLLPAGHRLGVAVLSSNAAWALPDTTASVNAVDVSGASELVVPVSSGASTLKHLSR